MKWAHFRHGKIAQVLYFYLDHSVCRLLCFISGMIAIIYVYKIWVDFGTSFACINFYMLIWDNKSLKINLLLEEILSLNAMYKLHFAYSDRQSCPCPFLETV